MKNISIAVLGLFLSSIASAWEIPQNPDRWPSIGVSGETSSLTGDFHETNPAPVNMLMGNSTYQTSTIGASLRLPVHSALTLEAAINQLTLESVNTRQGDTYKAKQRVNGYSWSIGLRYYIK